MLKGYIISKTLAERAVLSYNDIDNGKLEVVTLPCGLVGGETLLSYLATSVGVLISQLTGDSFGYTGLKLMQEVNGSVPLVHIEDVCQAHIFCMEQPSMRGRFCCAVASPNINEIASYFQENYSEHKIAKEYRSYLISFFYDRFPLLLIFNSRILLIFFDHECVNSSQIHRKHRKTRRRKQM